ncbi:ATP-dependent DNA helicase RecQ [Mycobacterium sp. CBMA271]|uniref:RecQ family ATP-dependent DNA helicase n=1 Tax=unclassified Mycobacteroides TaxID=2618759 RepID=UPI0012DDE0E7|nr:MULTISPECIES: DEAD/DEAH box helicase [unclassified Mycobacteroides]MUM18525.1 DEAD/DEAH box helicase [Mycobacteroides sp. CBMA 326]MUM23794.1 ATP-dependent DNA helicase RecQ [Mycobacteroides sp. CBMA 271]
MSQLSGARADQAREVIEALAGPGAMLREDQETAVTALLEPAARVLVVQATGWGKSAVYWVATAIRRAEGAGPALIVSPLLSLMRDQVAAAARAGLRAATLNSSNFDDWSPIEARLVAGDIDVLLVSPERLANPSFGRRVLSALEGSMGLLVIDEAHAVSDWGHDFRPDYRRVSDVLTRLNPQTPVLATTATANTRVTDDVATQLGDATLVLRGPLARRSLQLNVLPSMSPLARYAWVAHHLDELPGSGIVYVLTVADAQRLVDGIHAVHPQAKVAAYTGQLDADTRARLEDALRENQIKALIATSALGMGFDKPDLGFVIHVGSPPSPVSYYQQVGRAGRAIDHAAVVLLPSESDAGIWDYFTTASIPDPKQMETVLTALADEARNGVASTSVNALEAKTGIRRTRIELMVKQLAVDGAAERVDGGWQATGSPWRFDAAHYDGIIATRRREANIMKAYTRSERCLMQLLTESLDDPQAASCGRCSVCLGQTPDGLGLHAPAELMQKVATALRTNSTMLETRKMWPGGEFGARGKIPADLLAETGRVLVHADAPEWSGVITAADAGDPQAIEALTQAAVSTLARWRDEWVARPEIAVSLQLTGTPNPVQPVTDQIATIGRLRQAAMPVAAGTAPDRNSSGAAEAAHWRDAIGMDDSLREMIKGRCVLLVIDSTSTRWPVTVAAAHLRKAGARAVLPLLIHHPA